MPSHPRRIALAVAAVAALIAAACADEKPTRPASVTAPAAAAASAAIVGVPAASGSTVCAAYAKERAGYEAELKLTPGDERLQDQIRALDIVTADACN